MVCVLCVMVCVHVCVCDGVCVVYHYYVCVYAPQAAALCNNAAGQSNVIRAVPT